MRRICVVTLVMLWIGVSNSMLAKFKAIHCFVDMPEKLSFEKCFVKAVSRNISTFNMIQNLNGSFSSPILVSILVINSPDT